MCPEPDRRQSSTKLAGLNPAERKHETVSKMFFGEDENGPKTDCPLKDFHTDVRQTQSSSDV